MTAFDWPVPPKVAERFWAKVDWSGGPIACWPWTGARHKAGYGVAWYGQRLLAHRLAYMITNEPIRDDMTIDHVEARGCHTRLCCNPAHLEAVTRGENTARGLRDKPARYTPEQRLLRARAHLAERFWFKVQRGGDADCWLWCGYVDPKSKARFWREQASVPAQRVAWELGTGEPPDRKLVIENTCPTPNCMNPEHLRCVPRSQSRGNTRPGRHEERVAAGKLGMDIRWHS